MFSIIIIYKLRVREKRIYFPFHTCQPAAIKKTVDTSEGRGSINSGVAHEKKEESIYKKKEERSRVSFLTLFQNAYKCDDPLQSSRGYGLNSLIRLTLSIYSLIHFGASPLAPPYQHGSFSPLSFFLFFFFFFIFVR